MPHRVKSEWGPYIYIKKHHNKTTCPFLMWSQWALMKFQASAWPATFLATKLMVVTTFLRGILSLSKVYSRYLRGNGTGYQRSPSTLLLDLSSPAEQPDLGGTCEGAPEGFLIRRVVGALILVPGKLPLLLPASSQGVTVDELLQVGVDAEQQVQASTFWTDATKYMHGLSCSLCENNNNSQMDI